MNKNIKQAIEGLMFLSGNKGVTVGELIMILNVSEDQIVEQISHLKEELYENGSALTIIETAKNYKLVTTKDNYDYYQQYANMEFTDKLSTSALETLAIIAYNQPATRYSVEETRGVMTGHHFKTLLNKDLIKVIGKSEDIGKPNLYGTTSEFLNFLGINELEELPPLANFKLEIENNKEDLFSDIDDFKEIRKRLINSENIVKEIPELDLSEIDEIKVNDIKVSTKEEEVEGNGK